MVEGWWIKSGCKNNPLSTNPNPVIIGMDNLKRKIEQFVLNGDIVLVFGNYGTGKTSLLTYLETLRFPNMRIINYRTTDSKRKKFVKNWMFKAIPTFSKLFGKNIVLLIDEGAEQSSLTEEEQLKIKKQVETKAIHSVVITLDNEGLSGIGNKFREKARLVETPTPSQDDFVKIIDTRFEAQDGKNPMNDGSIKEVALHERSIPRKVISRVCDIIIETGRDNISLYDVQGYYNKNVERKKVPYKPRTTAREHSIKQPVVDSIPKRTAVFQEVIDKLSPLERAIVLSLEKRKMTLNKITDQVTKKNKVTATYFTVGKACSMMFWGGKGNKKYYQNKGIKFRILNKEKRGNIAIYSLSDEIKAMLVK